MIADTLSPACVSADLRPLKVLLIEDDREAAQALADYLRLTGHQVEVAHTGADGVELALTGHPDVILSDIGMPGLDGFAVARALWANPSTVGATLIAVTGHGDRETREAALHSGFDFVLTKPADPDTLIKLFPSE